VSFHSHVYIASIFFCLVTYPDSFLFFAPRHLRILPFHMSCVRIRARLASYYSDACVYSRIEKREPIMALLLNSTLDPFPSWWISLPRRSGLGSVFFDRPFPSFDTQRGPCEKASPCSLSSDNYFRSFPDHPSDLRFSGKFLSLHHRLAPPIFHLPLPVYTCIPHASPPFPPPLMLVDQVCSVFPHPMGTLRPFLFLSFGLTILP